MKLKNLKIKNFGKFTNFECEFDGKVTRLVGVNGAGKTTVGLTAIWACLRGIAEKNSDGQLIGERFRFIAPSQSAADIELTLVDTVKNVEIKIRNHITPESNAIKVEAPRDYPMHKGWLSDLMSTTFLSAKYFCQKSPKEQALLLGIDTAKFDKELKAIKEEFTLVNRDIKNLGDIPLNIEEVKIVSVSELVKEKDKIESHNLKIDKSREKQKEYLTLTQELENKLASLYQSLKDEKQRYIELLNISDRKDIGSLVEEIKTAEETNKKALLFEQAHEKLKKKTDLQNELSDNKLAQQKVIEERAKFIQSLELPLDGISVDDEGQLLLDGRPIKEPYFSKGELELIVAKLCLATQSPLLKLRFIDDFDLLDASNQEILINDLLGNDFQVITAEVSNDVSGGENVIVIRETEDTKG